MAIGVDSRGAIGGEVMGSGMGSLVVVVVVVGGAVGEAAAEVIGVGDGTDNFFFFSITHASTGYLAQVLLYMFGVGGVACFIKFYRVALYTMANHSGSGCGAILLKYLRFYLDTCLANSIPLLRTCDIFLFSKILLADYTGALQGLESDASPRVLPVTAINSPLSLTDLGEVFGDIFGELVGELSADAGCHAARSSTFLTPIIHATKLRGTQRPTKP